MLINTCINTFYINIIHVYYCNNLYTMNITQSIPEHEYNADHYSAD